MVSSARNPRVAAARRLLTPRGRAAAGAFLADGPQAVREALAHPAAPVRELYATQQGLARHPEIRASLEGSRGVLTLVDERVLAQLSDSVTPQGLVAVVDAIATSLDVVFTADPILVTMLVDVADPGNAGSVIRVADAAGARGVITTSGSVDVWGQKSVRASAGSVFHLPIASGVVVAEAVEAARAAGLVLLAADGAGSLDLDAAEKAGLLAQPSAWLFGNEARGLSPEVLELADHVVAVPIYGRAESLNLATAAAVCLYASAGAQRRA